MAKALVNVTAILIYLNFCYLKVQADYTAAITEFFPEQDRHLQPEDRLQRSVSAYIEILDQLSHDSQIDIIVYPEMTLSHPALITKHSDILPYAVEVEINQTSLCGITPSTFLTPLACAAIKYKTYMVINLYEKTPCEGTKCDADGWSFYNTNIVFDRSGAIISKYRKYNLFGEIYMTRSKKADISIFRTDFGESFAMFTCFDILFKQPPLDLVYKYGAKSVVYPTMWFSELPFLTSLQAQQQWAYATNVTFIASGANNRRLGSGGTGIYQGTNGPLLFTILGTDESKGFVAKIPGAVLGLSDTDAIDKKGRQMDDFYMLSDHLESYTSQLVLPNQDKISQTVCSQEFCCQFQVELEWQQEPTAGPKNQYQYHMVAFSGVRSFVGISNGGVEICAILACVNESLSSCGKRFLNYNTISWAATFKSIVIEAEFDVDENRFQFPNTLLSNIEPIRPAAFEWTSTTDTKRIYRTFTLRKPQTRLMTFGIYGRDFSRDSSVRNISDHFFYSE